MGLQASIGRVVFVDKRNPPELHLSEDGVIWDGLLVVAESPPYSKNCYDTLTSTPSQEFGVRCAARNELVLRYHPRSEQLQQTGLTRARCCPSEAPVTLSLGEWAFCL